jgi:hypothetical protein
MDLSLLVLWALAGWCGHRGWPGDPFDHSPVPPPPRPPRRHFYQWPVIVWVSPLLGIIGGWLYKQLFPCAPLPDCPPFFVPVATSMGAFLLARFGTDLLAVLFRPKIP